MTVKVLCIGHGPSRLDYDFIRNFDGLLLAVDASTHELIEDNIIPDYSLYSETGHTIIRNLEYFMPDYFSDTYIKDNMTVVFQKEKMVYVFEDRLKDMDMKYLGFDGRYGAGLNHTTQAVGLYAICYADRKLKADEIHLIGYDYKGLDNDGRDMCEQWKETTLHYLMGRRNAKCKGVIIDHSQGNFPIL